jgi:uncharacterized membrane protein YdbT with pleckstrin-like domain
MEGHMAGNYIQNMLGDREKIVFHTRQHWFVLFASIVFELLLIAAIIAGVSAILIFFPTPFSWLGYILLIIPAIGILGDVLTWVNRQYIISNRRVIQVNGIINKNVIDSSLEKVNDVKMVQSFWGRLFGYGDVQILTASELGANLFKRIGDPIAFKTAMLNAKEKLSMNDEGIHAGKSASLLDEIKHLHQLGLLTDDEYKTKVMQLTDKQNE